MDVVTSKLLPDPHDQSGDETRGDEPVSPIKDAPAFEVTVPLFVEAVTSRAATRHHIAWADLCARALEPNVFLDPGFAVPLMQHVAPHSRPDVLLVWEGNGPTSFGRLVGLMPVALPRYALLGIARAYHDEQIALGAPLLDADRAREAFAAMITWLHGNAPRATALLFETVPSGGPFETVARSVCEDLDLDVRRLAERGRAIFRPHPEAGNNDLDGPAAKRRKEWRRQSRRLSEVGARTYRSATTPNDVARALEQFLALEHNGWKGRRGTSLLADGRRATFARTMSRLMAHEGQCRIEAIEIDGKPVAMGILLTSGARVHFWKTAFDESLSTLSPGVQFVRDLTERLRLDPSVAEIDSCALPHHAMIDRLWPERMLITDLMIGLERRSGRRFERAARWEDRGRRIRAKIKDLVIRLRAR